MSEPTSRDRLLALAKQYQLARHAQADTVAGIDHALDLISDGIVNPKKALRTLTELARELGQIWVASERVSVAQRAMRRELAALASLSDATLSAALPADERTGEALQ